MARNPITIKTKTEAKVRSSKDGDIVIKEIEKLFNTLSLSNQVRALEQLGCGKSFFTCQRCDHLKKKDDFYVSTAAYSRSGVTNACKDCAASIAIPTVNGKPGNPTKESVDAALYALDKPFLDAVWDSSLLEAANGTASKPTTNVYYTYIKNIQMQNYYTMTYKDSDNYTGGILSIADNSDNELPADQEILVQFEKNKADALRLLGYLPFEKEKLSDQPFLYSQLIGFLDASEQGNDDMMRTSSIISIVRGFLQESQIDDMIAGLVQDPINAEKNLSTIKALHEMKRNITLHITKLAEQSCISLKNSKEATKGENTWTGKVKKLKDLNIRSAQVNGFDIATCRGMQQVQEISDASIMKQLALDESEWSDMVAELRKTAQDLRKERDQYQEINRILLQENLDLKDLAHESGISIDTNIVDLKSIYSCFSDKDEGNLPEESSDEEPESEDSYDTDE